MKKVFLAAACSVILFAGCKNVELAQREITPEEKAWRAYIKDCYPAWTPSETLPPGVERSDADEPAVSGAGADVLPYEPGPVRSAGSAVPSPAAASAAQEYTIVKGDTLGKISQKFYGTSRRYQKIYDANRDVLKSPDKLVPGTKIRIPAR